MLLKLFNDIRNNKQLFRRFVERGEMSVERRIQIAREYQLSDPEIEAALGEDVAMAQQIIRAQAERAFAGVGLDQAYDGTAEAGQSLRGVLDAIVAEIAVWDQQFADHAWPGAKRPCVESVSPAVATPDTETEYTIDGWFLDDRELEGQRVLGIYFCGAGKSHHDPSTIKPSQWHIEALPHRRYRIRTTMRLPGGSYDLVLGHNTLLGVADGQAPIVSGLSRLPGALSVNEPELP